MEVVHDSLFRICNRKWHSPEWHLDFYGPSTDRRLIQKLPTVVHLYPGLQSSHFSLSWEWSWIHKQTMKQLFSFSEIQSPVWVGEKSQEICIEYCWRFKIAFQRCLWNPSNEILNRGLKMNSGYSNKQHRKKIAIVSRERNSLLFIFLLIKNVIKLIRWDKEIRCHTFHWGEPVSIRFDFKLNSPGAVHPGRAWFC